MTGLRLAVLASGSGSNFEALVTALHAQSPHRVVLLLGDKPGLGAYARAERLGVPWQLVPYQGRPRAEAEADLNRRLQAAGIELVVLAGFMRLLGADFVRAWKGRLVNIHPSLLPRHPGAHGIADSYASGDTELGISIHWVDEGLDSGPLLRQASFARPAGASLAEVEARIHALEHEHYPQVVRLLADRAAASMPVGWGERV